MNELEKLLNTKKTENGDIAYTSTGNNLVDILFMQQFFEKHLDEVKIGNSEREKLFAMYMRDPRFGQGRRDLGRELLKQANAAPEEIVRCGRYDDLWHIPTNANLDYLKRKAVEDNLCKKWLPRLHGKDKLIAKALREMWGLNEKGYRKLIKTDDTTEYKLSYAEIEENKNTPLNELFNKNEISHPLVDTIDFEKVPSLAMQKYLHAFSTREDIKPRFDEYMEAVKENKAKVNTKTANVVDAYKTTMNSTEETQKNAEILSNKVNEQETESLDIDAIAILDTSGSMEWCYGGIRTLDKAYAIAYNVATHSNYAKNQVISFSSRPKLMTIKGDTLKEKYRSMYTGDCTNTDFGKVMELLRNLNKYPKYLIVISDMEFDDGSNQSKEETMRIFKEYGADTKIIWWNLNDRNKTTPEVDEYGNFYIGGYNLQVLNLIKSGMNMDKFIDEILDKYKKDINYK